MVYIKGTYTMRLQEWKQVNMERTVEKNNNQSTYLKNSLLI